MRDLTGETFGRLKVIALSGIKRYKVNKKGRKTRSIKMWLCECECGNKTEVQQGNLLSGHTASCGCLQKQRLVHSRKKYNDYEVQEDYVIMYTYKNEPFYVDVDDFAKIRMYSWYKDNHGYITTTIKSKNHLLHRFIMNVTNINYYVDHINHDITDNRKCNLRIVTPSQNNYNMPIRKDNTSGVKGVSWSKQKNKWHVRIMKKHIGFYDDIKEAEKARKEAEIKYYGEYAYKGE